MAQITATTPITLAFCISDSYAQHAAVVMASARAGNPHEYLAFHIFSGNLSEGNRAKLSAMAEVGRLDVVFHQIERTLFAAFPTHLEYITQEAYYRYAIPTLMSGRVIYSDVDVLVCGLLRPLWETRLTDAHPVAAVREICDERGSDSWHRYKAALGLAPDTPYFYSGLLVMDCDRLRQEKIPEALFADTAHCARVLDTETFSASDQVVINRVLAGRITALSPEYCVTGAHLRRGGRQTIIRHYAGYYEKPWCNIAWN